MLNKQGRDNPLRSSRLCFFAECERWLIKVNKKWIIAVEELTFFFKIIVMKTAFLPYKGPLLFTIFFLLFVELIYAAPVSFGIGGLRCEKEVKSFKEIRTKNIVTQSYDYSCGPASIATILNYYFADRVSEKDVINYLLLTTDLQKVKKRKGFSLLDLKKFAKSRGYDAVGYKMDLVFLAKLDKPVIVPINIKDYNHFVIFKGIRKGRVFIADPVLGNMTMRSEKFQRIWNQGIGMMITKKGYESKTNGLTIPKEEEVFLTDYFAQHIIGESVLGRVFADGEF